MHTMFTRGDFNMAKTDTIHLRVEPELKNNAEILFAQLGISTTEAIKIFLNQAVLNNGLPFEVKVPQYNSRVLAAMEEARIISEKDKAYTSAREMFEENDNEI